MNAHVTSTDFLPGTVVGLYPPQTRPEAHHEPIERAEVPESGQVVFEREIARERFWLAGEAPDGRWRTVQCHSKPGDPVNVRAVLELTRPEESEEPPVVGARGTRHAFPRMLRRG